MKLKLRIGLQRGVLIYGIINIAILILFAIGYVKDIIHLLNCDFKGPLKAEILYGIGAVTGLGGIFGWINFGK